VGAAENPRKVKWSTGAHILIAMIITIPVTMLMSAALYLFVSLFTGV
jgi:phosphate/sulfate permease